MAHTSAVAPREQSFFKAIGLNTEAITRFINAYFERRCRTGEIARLEAMSDEELAKQGIRRDEIVLHVFRDRLYA